MTLFNELGLAEPLIKAIAETGYETPTPIQLKAIPPILTGADLLGIAQTGTGKTAAFALPILHRLAADPRPAPRKGCRVLVLSPTRELATQIADSFRTYGKHMGFTVAVIFGGVSERPQANALARGIDVLVATPGRLLDHIGQRNAVLSGTEIFVLDEADQMLDLGFFVPIRKIVAQLTTKRQSLFFSATMPKEIEKLTTELLKNPVRVAVTPQATTVERITQKVIHIEQSKKKSLLTELLSDPQMARTLVFTRTKRGADKVAKHLTTANINVAAIHGNKSQNQREGALDAFRRGEIRVLVATDIAARGIDVDLVTHVVNYELPDVPEAYVHRIGRTARAGATGIAVAFCDGGEREQLRDIERLTRQTIPSEDRRNDEKLVAEKASASQGGRGNGGRSHGGRPSRDGGGGRDRDHAPSRSAQRSDRGRGDRPAGARDGARDDAPWSNHASPDRKPRDDMRRDDRTDRSGWAGRSEVRTDVRADDRGQRPQQAWAPSTRSDDRPRGTGERGRDASRSQEPRGERAALNGAGFSGRPVHAGPRNDQRRSDIPRGDRPPGDRTAQSNGARPNGPSRQGKPQQNRSAGGKPAWRGRDN